MSPELTVVMEITTVNFCNLSQHFIPGTLNILETFFLLFSLFCLHIRVSFPVMVTNFKIFVQLSTFLNGFFFIIQQFATLTFSFFNFRDLLIPETFCLKVAKKVPFETFATFSSNEIFL